MMKHDSRPTAGHVRDGGQGEFAAGRGIAASASRPGSGRRSGGHGVGADHSGDDGASLREGPWQGGPSDPAPVGRRPLRGAVAAGTRTSAPTPTRLISVVTAVHAPGAHFLPAAYSSLVEQLLPDGWDWQWVIQEDGESDQVEPYVPDDPRISFGQGRAGRSGMARTMALSRVTGEFVKVLDADDMLTPGALARDLHALLDHPDSTWATSRALDLLPDGSLVGFDDHPLEGYIERGTVLKHWQANGYLAQVHPASLFVRRDVLLALGGWMALPASPDTGLLMALDAVSRGWFTAETGLLYRKWPGQVTSQPAHVQREERQARMAVIEARAQALAALLG